MSLRHHSRPAAALAVAALAAALTGCADRTEAEDDSLLVWSWDDQLPEVAELYEEEHPGVEIDVVDVGTGDEQYTALQNVIAAGSGSPDVAFLDSTALPQFALSGALADLGPLGADELSEEFAPGPWAASQVDGTVYGLPWASGPMVLFYNRAVFERLGVAVPGTWEEYVGAAEQLHAADPEVYILNDVGNPGLANSLIQQAGGRPFSVDGTAVAIDLADPGTARYAENWQRLLDGGLLAPVADWSDEWRKMLAAGRIATLPAGSWMASALTQSAPDAAGDWRVAQLPQWEPGGSVTAEHGGGGFSVLESSVSKELAVDFLTYATAGDGVDVIRDSGLWPAHRAATESPAFLDRPSEYFGGQAVNREYATASENAPDDVRFLPYQVYAAAVFNDSVGTAYTGETTLQAGLLDWQAELEEYGAEQGFTVER
ncbi:MULTISPECIES: sugar ABC transporter substrate-binding protein [unclassified Rathayibacter]|uniref:ABC transporter substrate-binding protein n=1 Tax=unclassified Rathayibacter TaxID=2609250 RepID=UPI001FB1D75B|nr:MULTISPECIES: sugar ABC transporter substrate-binding protein [unclassified Rathayibacter]MCJ1674901.1 sugar ABC transporter substrate-binding protein [Rathayibacter sp. VKM Ac-2929]MCJ1683647.1 sugar ABC transporter substrate-binding protein [Rathayibacter sp. VKM Ac-2928]